MNNHTLRIVKWLKDQESVPQLELTKGLKALNFESPTNAHYEVILRAYQNALGCYSAPKMTYHRAAVEVEELLNQYFEDTGETYVQYENEINKEAATPELTEQEIIDLFKDAPEWATHKMQRGDSTEFARYSCCTYYCDKYNEIEHSNFVVANGAWQIIATRPPEPVYTLQMQEAGEMPKIGSKAYVKYPNGNHDCEIIGYHNGEVWFFGMGIYKTIMIDKCEFSQIEQTVKIEDLEDEQPYKFRLNGQKIGFYRKDRKSFFTELHGGNKICSEAQPFSIIKLISER